MSRRISFLILDCLLLVSKKCFKMILGGLGGKIENKSNNTETKKSKFDWIKKLNIFKKSESQKKEEKNK